MMIIPTGWFHQAMNPEECIAVSSEMFNAKTAHIVIQEIFNGGTVHRHDLPDDFEALAPKQQVLAVMDALPDSALREGQRRLDEAVDQVRDASRRRLH